MGLKLVMNILPIFLFFSSASASKEILAAGEFKVTSAKYAAKPNYDITQVLANAWKDAWASTSASKVIIPRGTYKLKEASFKGPCNASVEIQVQCTLQPPQDGSQLFTSQ